MIRLYCYQCAGFPPVEVLCGAHMCVAHAHNAEDELAHRHPVIFNTDCVWCDSQAGPPVSLVLNKTDLLPPAEVAAVVAQAADWGYDALPICAATGAGMSELAERLAGRVTVLAGPSGEAFRRHVVCEALAAMRLTVDFECNLQLPDRP